MIFMKYIYTNIWMRVSYSLNKLMFNSTYIHIYRFLYFFFFNIAHSFAIQRDEWYCWKSCKPWIFSIQYYLYFVLNFFLLSTWCALTHMKHFIFKWKTIVMHAFFFFFFHQTFSFRVDLKSKMQTKTNMLCNFYKEKKKEKLKINAIK